MRTTTTLAPDARLAVRFVRRWRNYFAGDVASFPARMSATLVARNVAERVNIAPPGADAPQGAEWATRPPGNPTFKGGADEIDDFIL